MSLPGGKLLSLCARSCRWQLVPSTAASACMVSPLGATACAWYENAPRSSPMAWTSSTRVVSKPRFTLRSFCPGSKTQSRSVREFSGLAAASNKWISTQPCAQIVVRGRLGHLADPAMSNDDFDLYGRALGLCCSDVRPRVRPCMQTSPCS